MKVILYLSFPQLQVHVLPSHVDPQPWSKWPSFLISAECSLLGQQAWPHRVRLGCSPYSELVACWLKIVLVAHLGVLSRLPAILSVALTRWPHSGSLCVELWDATRKKTSHRANSVQPPSVAQAGGVGRVRIRGPRGRNQESHSFLSPGHAAMNNKGSWEGEWPSQPSIPPECRSQIYQHSRRGRANHGESSLLRGRLSLFVLDLCGEGQAGHTKGITLLQALEPLSPL